VCFVGGEGRGVVPGSDTLVHGHAHLPVQRGVVEDEGQGRDAALPELVRFVRCGGRRGEGEQEHGQERSTHVDGSARVNNKHVGVSKNRPPYA